MKGNASMMYYFLICLGFSHMFHFLANEETMRLLLQRCDAINAKINFLEKNTVKKKKKKSGTLKQHTQTLVAISFFNNVIISLVKTFHTNKLIVAYLMVSIILRSRHQPNMTYRNSTFNRKHLHLHYGPSKPLGVSIKSKTNGIQASPTYTKIDFSSP